MTRTAQNKPQTTKTQTLDTKDLRGVTGGASMDPLPGASFWGKSGGKS